MDFNRAEELKDTLKKKMLSFERHAEKTARDADEIIAFVEKVVADNELKDDLIGAIQAGGISLTEVQSYIQGVKNIRDAIAQEVQQEDSKNIQ